MDCTKCLTNRYQCLCGLQANFLSDRQKNGNILRLFKSSSRTHVRLGAWFWSAQADIFFSESLHSTLRSGRRKTIVSQTMCALAEHLSQSEIELPLRNTCYYSPLAEVGVSTQTEIKRILWMTRANCNPHFTRMTYFCAWMTEKASSFLSLLRV